MVGLVVLVVKKKGMIFRPLSLPCPVHKVIDIGNGVLFQTTMDIHVFLWTGRFIQKCGKSDTAIRRF